MYEEDTHELLGKLEDTVYELESKVETLTDECGRLRSEKESLQKQVESERNRASRYKEKNRRLRKYLKTTMSMNIAHAGDFNWHGVLCRTQYWRPPHHEEMMDYAHFLQKFCYGGLNEDPEDFDEEVKMELSSSYMVVLDDYKSDSPGYAGRLMFVVHGTPKTYEVYVWRGNRLTPLPQAEDARRMLSQSKAEMEAEPVDEGLDSVV